MYKDKDKQKEANRLASQKRRNKAKGMTDVLTNEHYVIPGSNTGVIPKHCDGLEVTDEAPSRADLIDGIPPQFLPGSQSIIEQRFKGFDGLPLDVQHTIDRISTSPEERAQRIAIALDYQAKHPGSRHKGIDYDSQPRSTAKPGDADYQSSGIEERCGCGAVLPELERPRMYPAKCYRCSTGAEAVA